MDPTIKILRFLEVKDETRQVIITDINSDGLDDIIAANVGEKNMIFFNDELQNFQTSMSL